MEIQTCLSINNIVVFIKIVLIIYIMCVCVCVYVVYCMKSTRLQ